MINLVSLDNKDKINILYKINNYNNPDKIYIPSIYIDKKIKLNDYIYKNTYFKDYIVSISGYITGVEKIKYNNKLMEALVITNDYKENVLKKSKKIKLNNKEELEFILKNNFFNNILNELNKQKNIENLIITSIDEEIYSINEFMCLKENYCEILETIDLLSNILKPKKTLLVTKNTDFKVIKNVKSIIGTYPNININLVPDKYLISNKEFLCNYLNINKENTLIIKTSELYNIYKLINGKDISNKLITISGNAVKNGVIVNTKLGVYLKDIINEYIEITNEDYDIYINGKLMGKKVFEKNIIIDKYINYIVINKTEEIEETECINCGACKKICPYNINVKYCYLNKLNHKKCIGCGLCNYICPANINLKDIVKSDNVEKE